MDVSYDSCKAATTFSFFFSMSWLLVEVLIETTRAGILELFPETIFSKLSRISKVSCEIQTIKHLAGKVEYICLLNRPSIEQDGIKYLYS